MSLALFISKRLAKGKDTKKKISATIILIAQIAVALGIVVTLFTISIGIGFRQSIKERLSGFNGHINITAYNENNMYESAAMPDVEKLHKELQNINVVKSYQDVANKSGIIKTDDSYEGVIYKGLDKNLNRETYESYLVAGKIPHYGDLNDSVVISEKIAKSLKLKINQVFNMYFFRDEKPVYRNFVVAGIFKTDIKELDQNFMLGDIEHVRRLNRWQNKEVGAVEVFVQDIDKLREDSEQVYNAIGSKYYAQNAYDSNKMLINWVDLFDVNMLVIIGIIFFVVAINIIMALLILIIDRTPMIGTLKALGASNWQIRKTFLYNAIFILTKGLLWGNVIAISCLVLQKIFGILKLDPEFYYVNVIPVYLNPLYILAVNIVAILLCALVLLLPTYIISKIPPVKAIRFR